MDSAVQWNPANNITIINYIIYVSYYIVPNYHPYFELKIYLKT